MGRVLPNWLAKIYSKIIFSFGYLPFTTRDAALTLEAKKYPISILLARMCSYGWLERLERGVYRAIPPIVALMEASGFRWRSKVKQRDRLPVLEFIVARLVEEFGPKLWSIVLFGSLARGSAKDESDIDLLVVVEDLPEKYSERVKVIGRVVYCYQLDQLIQWLWREKGVYATPNILLITPEEAEVTQPFYLDIVDEGIVIFDRGNFMAKKFGKLRGKLKEIGAMKVLEPDGSWYWILPDKIGDVEL